MNVLVINGSPKGKNSNTLKLSNAFLEGAGWDAAENANLYELAIKPCRGCFACWNKTPGTCVIHDDMTALLEKIVSADVLIWSFPLYYYSVPSVLKCVLDRLLPTNLPFMVSGAGSGGHPARYDIAHQRHIVISTCGFWTAEGNYTGVEAIFDRMYGTNAYLKLFCGQGELFHVPELGGRTEAYLATVSRAGAEYAAGSITAGTQAALAEPLFPREAFEKMADASWGIDEHTEERVDESLVFTKQMAALFTPDGKERVLEFAYTDIGKTYQVILSKQGADVITQDFQPHTTKIETPFSVWQAISRGEITGQEALFQHKYKVSGDFEVMLHWDTLFGGLRSGKGVTAAAKVKKTNMLLLLMPWIVLWTALPINPSFGGILSIAVASCLPLLWLRYKPVLYEQISIPLVVMLSLCALLGVSLRLVIPISYGLFGLLWFATIFFKMPLTSYYSANNYGGDSAFTNPLFVKTNRILTGAWGVLYLFTTIWTYVLMGTAVSQYTGLINSAVPAIMGVFTIWFQRWYPAHWAKG